MSNDLSGRLAATRAVDEPIAALPPSLRQVPPWSGPVSRTLERAFFLVAALGLGLAWLGDAQGTRGTLHVATVESVDVVRHTRDPSPSARVRYAFVDDGVRVEGTELVSPDDPLVRPELGGGVGARVEVRRVLGVPQRSGEESAVVRALVGLALIALALGVAALVVRRRGDRRFRLVLEGELVRGEVVRAVATKSGPVVRWRVTYAYRRGAGADAVTYEGREAVGVLREESALFAGSPLVVACDPRDPARSALYALGEGPRAGTTDLRGLAELPDALRGERREVAPVVGGLVWSALPRGLVVGVLALLALGATLVGQPAEAIPLVLFGVVLVVGFVDRQVVPALRSRALRAHGAMLAALVDDARPVPGLEGCVQLSYEAMTPEGALVGLETIAASRLAALGKTPEPGDTVFVAVDRREPWRREVVACAPSPRRSPRRARPATRVEPPEDAPIASPPRALRQLPPWLAGELRVVGMAVVLVGALWLAVAGLGLGRRVTDIAGMTAALAGLGALVVLTLALQRRTSRRLALEGELHRGVVVSCALDRNAGVWRVTYAFRAGGDTHRGTTRLFVSTSSDVPFEHGLAADVVPGTSAIVACDPRDPKRSVLYAIDDERVLRGTTAPRGTPVGTTPGRIVMPRLVERVAPRVVVAALAALGSLVLVVGFREPWVAPLGALAHWLALLVVLAEVPRIDAWARSRSLLARGAPLAATITRLGTTPAPEGSLWVSFEADTPEGMLAGRLPVRPERAARMGGAPKAGDTVFLVVDRERPWEREIAGFAAA